MAEKFELIISGILRLILIFAAAFAIINAKWSDLFLIFLTLSMTFLPAIIGRSLRVTLPIEFELAFVLFIFAANFLGAVRHYYTLFWWWDILLHSISGLNLGLIGFIILYIIYLWKRISAGPFLIILFSFSFALALGALWEIYEFAMDSLFGLNMQKSGLVDTMWNLISDAGGALLASFFGYFYIKYRKGFFLKRVLHKLLENNPGLQSEAYLKKMN